MPVFVFGSGITVPANWDDGFGQSKVEGLCEDLRDLTAHSLNNHQGRRLSSDSPL